MVSFTILMAVRKCPSPSINNNSLHKPTLLNLVVFKQKVYDPTNCFLKLLSVYQNCKRIFAKLSLPEIDSKLANGNLIGHKKLYPRKPGKL